MSQSTTAGSYRGPATGSTTSQATGAARDTAQRVASRAQEGMQGAAQEAQGRLRSQLDERSTQAGEQVASTADDLRSVAEELRSKDKDAAARVAEQVADRAEQLASYLRDADGDRMMRDVEAFARRQPWAVAAGGLVVGFALSRFLKASGEQRWQASYGGNGGSGALAPTPSTAPLASQYGAPGTGANVAGSTGVASEPVDALGPEVLDEPLAPPVAAPGDVTPVEPTVSGPGGVAPASSTDPLDDLDAERRRPPSGS
ncbi:MAG TPA: hypothetical protein VHJ34_03405 [Actinomycetota bacterium]|nr:hypothetical protein [Actinomycetota bacterium]